MRKLVLIKTIMEAIRLVIQTSVNAFVSLLDTQIEAFPPLQSQLL